MSVSHTFRALQHRNYRLYFAGHGISLIGTWMQRVAMSWLVYRLTGSPAWLGIIGFSGNIPTFLLVPFAGAIIDRSDKRRVLVTTQTLAALQAATLFVLVWTDTVQVWHLVGLSLILASVNAFDMPGRQSMVVDMVDRREDLPNAIALNSTMVNSGKLLGPSIAGIAIGAFGEAVCFGINALSYVAVLGALIALRLPKYQPKVRTRRFLGDITDGAKTVFGNPVMWRVLTLLAVVSLVGIPYTVLMPVFAKEVLQGGPSTLGFLMSAPGFGAIIGALRLASLRDTDKLHRHVVIAAGVFGLALIGFSFSRWLPLSLMLLAVAGFTQMTQMASSNTILQTTTSDEMRGRTMSFYAMSFQGTLPFGNLLAGWAASLLGGPLTVAVCGTLSLCTSFAFSGLLRREASKSESEPCSV